MWTSCVVGLIHLGCYKCRRHYKCQQFSWQQRCCNRHNAVNDKRKQTNESAVNAWGKFLVKVCCMENVDQLPSARLSLTSRSCCSRQLSLLFDVVSTSTNVSRISANFLCTPPLSPNPSLSSTMLWIASAITAIADFWLVSSACRLYQSQTNLHITQLKHHRKTTWLARQ